VGELTGRGAATEKGASLLPNKQKAQSKMKKTDLAKLNANPFI
jgi:hypothetical protein